MRRDIFIFYIGIYIGIAGLKSFRTHIILQENPFGNFLALLGEVFHLVLVPLALINEKN